MRATAFGAAAAALACLGVTAPASAQGGLVDLVPRQEFTDANSVDLAGPTYRHREALLSIGGGARSLALTLNLVSPGSVVPIECFGEGYLGTAIYGGLSSNAYLGNTAPGTALYTAVLPHQSGKFWIVTSSGGQLPLIVTPLDDAYVTGAYDSNHSHFNYVGGDGTEATFSNAHQPRPEMMGVANAWGLDEVRFPDGETWTYRYNDVNANFSGCYGLLTRVRSIVSSRGYALQFDYAADPTGTVTSQTVMRNLATVVRVTAYSKASVYCNEALLQSCASVAALNSAVSFAYGSTATITKANGETVEFGFTQGLGLNLTSVTRPGGVTRTMTYQEWTEQDGPTYRNLATLAEAGRTWGYSLSLSYPGAYSTYRSEPDSATTRYDFNGTVPYQILDPLNRLTGITYGGWTRVLRHSFPEGNEASMSYDARGNLTAVRPVPKPNTGLPTLQATAVYPASCTATDRRSCNQPASTTDFNGNTTDYTYDPAHGGVLTETGPAAPTRQNDGSIASVRPQKRYEYAQRYAWVSNGAGGYVQAATPVWLLVRERTCRTTAASGSGCAGGAADEVVTDYDYGPSSGPNNLLLRGIAVTADAGAGPVTRRTCYTYDANGNRISETQPNANLASCS